MAVDSIGAPEWQILIFCVCGDFRIGVFSDCWQLIMRMRLSCVLLYSFTFISLESHVRDLILGVKDKLDLGKYLPRNLNLRKSLCGFSFFLVAISGLSPAISFKNIVCESALFLLALAALLAYMETRSFRTESVFHRREFSKNDRYWNFTLVAIAVLGGLSIQAWFKTGTQIAQQDFSPTIGLAFLSRIFQPMTWSGSNLGGINQAQNLLPWDAVVWCVHVAGGSVALAQRIWLTSLVIGVFVASAALVRSLGFSPTAGVAAACCNFFNLYTVTFVAWSDVYLAGMITLAAFPAILISFSRKRISSWQAMGLLIPLSLLLGFAYSNPPLVGVVVFVVVLTLFFLRFAYGKQEFRRGVSSFGVGTVAVIGLLSFIIVPAVLALMVNGSVPQSIVSLQSWSWQESRATLANGLWLNDIWQWGRPQYFGFAYKYSQFPLDIVRWLVPITAFLPLVLTYRRTVLDMRLLRIASSVSLLCIFIIYLSTGTNRPGKFVFDELYKLPFGWLLQEPGRFLIVVALGYAILFSITVHKISVVVSSWSRRLPHASWSKRFGLFSLKWGTVVMVVLASTVAAFPLLQGAISLNKKAGFPSVHVSVPVYWINMVRYLNIDSVPGSLLVLPPDSFYQMPYHWFYGIDNFIPSALSRHVIIPVSQGYFPATNELMSAVRLEASALQSQNWVGAVNMLSALQTPFVLVRGDIVPGFQGLNITSPQSLISALASDPFMRLIKKEGPLALYEVRHKLITANNYDTINENVPNLKILEKLPLDTSLISSPPQLGHTSLYVLPSVYKWPHNARSSSFTFSYEEARGWMYSEFYASTDASRSKKRVSFTLSSRSINGKRYLIVSTKNLVRDGSFESGLWNPVGNCNANGPPSRPRILSAKLLSGSGPNGQDALSLAGSFGRACESTQVDWTGGPIDLSFWVKSMGGVPGFCVLEEPSSTCAPATKSLVVSTANWSQFNTRISPNQGTTSLRLFLYSNLRSVGHVATVEYTGVLVLPDSSETPILVGVPVASSGSKARNLLAYPTGYSNGWSGSVPGQHVIVDGLRNGWLVNPSLQSKFEPQFNSAKFELRGEVTLTVLAVSFLVAITSYMWIRNKMHSI